MTKVGHWVSPEKAVWSLGCASQKNCLNEVKPHGSASTEPVIFCCGKTAAATLFLGLLQFFAVTICAGLIPLDLLIALTVTARKPTEYCFIDAVWESGGNPEQPSIAVS